MSQATIMCEREMPNQIRQPRSASPHLRQEVDNMLRDVAFVLKQTYRLREEILRQQGRKQAAGV